MKETMMKILKSFGLDKELDLYLQLFHKTPATKFAVVKISGNTLEEKLLVVAEDLAFLSKLGLTPIVVHGGGKQIDKQLEKNGLAIKKVSGLRITDKETMKIAYKVMNNITNKLVKAITNEGGHAINANGLELIEVEKKPPVKGIDLGFVGDLTKIKTDKITELCQSGYIPILASIGHKEDVAYNLNADTLASGFVKRLKPKKFILITETGGVLDKNEQIISTIDISTDLPELIKQNVITEGMLLKVKEIETLLEKAPTTVVEVCSAENLLQELFTVKGSGTFIRYGGNFIIRKSFKGLNTTKIKKLLEESFGKELVPGYFYKAVDSVITDKDYSGIMIVKKINGVPYLDKFAITKSAQGNGLGKAMWTFVKNHYPTLIWRSSITNPINNWYFKNCDGIQKSNGWIIFWYNVSRTKATALIPIISKIPKTLVKK
ncbi:acetylglutamate kinase [Candidatus Micrarchaeota archaeon]|nr:acetylglutamate kinase [Candidatus Micrarchaeota archaeon]